ncbi:MAG: hypothetical protein MJK14_16500 [Rivularia sp. ALOHA_DT_140]|nr:hypothetical protein [Rivularia sp. ALOHA_DT_140]
MNDIKLPIYFAYARSGGTLLNRCLASISGNFVLSEVNPHASVISIEVQARNWLKLVSQENYDEFASYSYIDKILYLAKNIQRNHSFLIIRDWVALNFLPRAVPIYDPSMILESAIYFERNGIEIIPIAFVRRSAEVYESITRTFSQFKKLSVQEFGSFYLAYAKAVCKYPIFYYENFCHDPENELKRICSTLQINYDDNFIDNFHKFNNCTGDSNPNLDSRGYALQKITIMANRNNSEQYLAANLDDNCQEADKILGFQEIKTEEKIDNMWKLVQSRDRALMQSEQRLHQAYSDLEQTQAELKTSQSQLQETQAELEISQSQLQQIQFEVSLINNSKFWKLRNAWFKFKSLLIKDAK